MNSHWEGVEHCGHHSSAQVKKSRRKTQQEAQETNGLQQSLTGSCVKNSPNTEFPLGMVKKFLRWMVVMVAQ